MSEGTFLNGNGKATTWLLGVFATLSILVLGFVINAILSLNTRAGALEVLSASSLEKLKYLESITSTIFPEKMEYVVKHADLANKVSSIENGSKLLESRLATISERLLTINARLDTISLQDGTKDKLKGKQE